MAPCGAFRPGAARLLQWFLLAIVCLSTACEDGDGRDPPPPPQALTRDSVGYFCGMIVEDHEGPKGQAILVGADSPLWFTSARDTLAFMILPEEPKSVAAVYVTDMGKAATWEHPEGEAAVWIDARAAWYVIGSRKVGGMGQPEAVPFAERAGAEAFAGEFGGEVVDFPAMPPEYVLGSS